MQYVKVRLTYCCQAGCDTSVNISHSWLFIFSVQGTAASWWSLLSLLDLNNFSAVFLFRNIFFPSTQLVFANVRSQIFFLKAFLAVSLLKLCLVFLSLRWWTWSFPILSHSTLKDHSSETDYFCSLLSMKLGLFPWQIAWAPLWSSHLHVCFFCFLVIPVMYMWFDRRSM